MKPEKMKFKDFVSWFESVKDSGLLTSLEESVCSAVISYMSLFNPIERFFIWRAGREHLVISIINPVNEKIKRRKQNGN